MLKDKELKKWLDENNQLNKENLNVVSNEISVLFSDNSQVTESFERYKNTTKYVHSFFKNLGLDYCCIKALRVYSHFNTDLNIAVRKDDFNNIIQFLEEDGWSRRSRWSQFKENIAEHGKRKLVCNKGRHLSEIHLYPGLSWHGFEYTSPDDVLINREETTFFNNQVYNTNKSLDLISNIGHALFERYKVTSGEAFHLITLFNECTNDEIRLAEKLTKKNGWGNSFILMKGFINSLSNQPTNTFPILINRKILWSAWAERFIFQIRNFRLFSAFIELAFNIIWSGPIYKLYSILKKIFTGKTGIEKKYGDLE